ncbi:probable inactive histone-lysine N-methyltransferase SUVR2 isoform X1 [Lolium perenne]|uniref:probable inactive histone-lysine N-methyltransferase SUVR2 isoform X1 n=1 Tax=Lolium perenne TaxID=4522 RepID=UPI0021F56E57|nr:probable inactive histone-lysine N-methyltransferase SUVR2 isoform X1 [Lolium perenne]
MGSSRPVSKQERGRRAMKAMKPLGFSSKLCSNVLRRLLELYDHRWALIEDDNYRVFAEAILDAQANGNGDPQPELEQEETDDFPAEGGPSTSLAAAATREDPLGPPSPPPSCPTAEHQGTTTELAISPRADSPPLARGTTRVLGKRRQRQTIDAYLQPEDGVFLREPKPEPVDMDCCDVQPGLVCRSPRGVASSSGLREPPPPQSGRNPKQIPGARNRTFQRCRNREIIEPTSSSLNNGTGSAVGNVQEAPDLHIVVASSAMGEIKMSLKCSVDPSKFRMPALEEVFKMVDDKCLASSKVLPPDFSVGSLLTEICQCVLQLGTEHAVEHTAQPDIVGNGCRSEDDRKMKQKAAEELLVSNGSENWPVNSTPVQQQHLALSTLRINHDLTDISKAEENIRISIVNEFGGEKFPPSFYYIPQNVVFQNALVDMSLAKIGGEDCCADCFGNCLSAPEPCACARETGGEYAYTLEGLVRPALIDECVSVNLFPAENQKVFCETCPLERSRNKASPEPCRGHLVRKFIKECWSKCGCNMECGNRVVQRGITCNLQVFFTGEGTGWGLRTLDELPKGAFVCEYAGEILTCTEMHERAVENMQNDSYVHPILLDAGWCSELKDEEALCLDGSFYGNVGRFINHRCCDANLAVIPIEVETPDHHYYHLAFFTSKKVEAFEELTWDYGIDFETKKQPVKPFECLCGSRYCRGRRHHLRKRSIVAAAAIGEEG